MSKKKVVILGGGAGAMTTAFYLSSTPELRAAYEVHVYQLGWRLGGKGASGRGPHGRIEEHGLHLFWGFYDNSLAMMRDAYEALGRPATAPLATFDQAFKHHDLVVMEEFFGGEWRRWDLLFARNGKKPGTPGMLNSPWFYIREMLSLLVSTFTGPFGEMLRTRNWDGEEDRQSKRSGLLDDIVSLVEHGLERLLPRRESRPEFALLGLLEDAHELAADLADRDDVAGDKHGDALVRLLSEFRRMFAALVRELVTEHYDLYRLYIAADFLIANLIGIVVDQVFVKGFNSIEGEDYRAWLGRHGASQLTLRSSLPRAIYDAAMSMVRGDREQQLMGAGSALRASLRIGLTYKGSVLYKFAASMGETIFVPLYEVCKARGVVFHFFSKVLSVSGEKDVATGKLRVDKIKLQRQADVKDLARGYEPLIPVKNLPCWPSEPLYDQLVQGEELKKKGINLESFYTPWPGVAEFELRLGVDFDHVLYAIPVASIPFLCPSLMALSPRFAQMATGVTSIQTQAFQLWVSRDRAGLGFEGAAPALSTFVEPIDTWGDLSDLVPREGWVPPIVPKSIGYFCGPMPGPERPPPPTEVAFPQQMLEQATVAAERYMNENLGALWPRATLPERDFAFDRSLLVPPPRAGDGLLSTQYVRANVDPNERYTLALPGELGNRLAPGDTGFDNLTISGDWVDNGFYVGCFEGTVMAGKLAYRAITGLPLPIYGEEWNR